MYTNSPTSIGSIAHAAKINASYKALLHTLNSTLPTIVASIYRQTMMCVARFIGILR